MIVVRIYVLLLLMFLSANAIAEYNGQYWIVRGNDTLYGIARSFYPSSQKQQARLRQDIIRLNQNVFAAGKRSLFIGLRLYMPDYVAGISPSSKKPAKKAAGVTVTTQKKPAAAGRKIADNQWRIKRGDTLYSIGRFFYPKSNRDQYKLRQDIRQLNPRIFAKGARGLETGMLLILPDYVVKRSSIKAKPVLPPKKPVRATSPVKPGIKNLAGVTPRPDKKIKPESKSDQQQAVAKKTTRTTIFKSTSSDFSSAYSLVAGYSSGGDKALPATGGHDISYGSGFHVQLTYDGLWNNKQGFRVGIGTQMDSVTAGSDSGELTQNYLQVLYIYNLHSSLMGIGLANHSGIHFNSDIGSVVTDINIGSASGLSLFYEYKKLFGENIIGLSHSSLEADLPAGGGKVDMSRTELYYRWEF